MIKEWLEEYKPKNIREAEQALREIMQEIALAGLERNGFFEHAAFYGGTALRIFYNLPRFSEDLDFSLLTKNPDFDLQPYLDGIKTEFEGLGITVTLTEKNKSNQSAIDSAFLKADTTWKEIILKEIIPQDRPTLQPEIKIKIEIDTHPPLKFTTNEKLLLRPFSFYVKCFSLQDLFAGKMHALLFRKWKQRVKGRDWFDLEWYIRNKIPLNLNHLAIRAYESGDWKKPTMTEHELMHLLQEKIKTVSFDRVRDDIARFIPDPKAIEIWSASYFTDLIKHLIFSK